jgi:alkylation response protein AidB-like acyl-CoA dehydrogenase
VSQARARISPVCGTRADEEGDHFVVNGQKLWTSGAHDADVLLTFVRTDPAAAPHKGISVLLIRTDSEGVSRRPFPPIYDRHQPDFNEVFFSDVRVPAENLVGPLNGGWQVANGSLDHERTMMWMNVANRLRDLLEDFHPAGPVDRDHYATLAMDHLALRLLGSAALARASRGERDTAAVSVLKLLGTEAEQTAARHALEAAGADGLVDPTLTASFNPYGLDLYTASWFARYAGTYAGTTAGGTSEIQRNIIAQRVLGLPR